MADPIRIPGLDLDLHWRGEPERHSVGERHLTVTAGARTDLFHDPLEGEGRVNAPALLATVPDADQQLQAHVRVDFRETFDAGVLLAWVDEQRYAKLCFERSPAGEPMIVTVVTRDVSDDANAYVVDGDRHWLRISTLDRALAFHASADGERWQLVRYFVLGGEHRPQLGFVAQSPVGEGCEVAFTDVAHRMARLGDLRGGG